MKKIFRIADGAVMLLWRVFFRGRPLDIFIWSAWLIFFLCQVPVRFDIVALYAFIVTINTTIYAWRTRSRAPGDDMDDEYL